SRREGTNIYSTYAVSGYICAAAAVESYLNEIFLSDLFVTTLPDGPIQQLTKAELENAENINTKSKLILLPLLAYTKTINREGQVYRDTCALLQIRNELTHFKFKLSEGGVKKIMSDLVQRKVAFSDEASQSVFPTTPNVSAWSERLSTTEGIRWS